MEQNMEKLQQEIKESYKGPQMSDEQLERLKHKIEQAKKENQRARRKAIGTRIAAAAAIVVCMLFVLPNTSKTVALAMQQIPLLGDLVELITVRNYQYEDEQYHADINVGEIVLSEAPEQDAMEAPVKEELKKTTEEINAEIDKFVDEKHLIINQIQALNDPKHIELLYKRYVEFKRLEAVAVEMNYTYQYIVELHGYALKEFQSTHENLLNSNEQK